MNFVNLAGIKISNKVILIYIIKAIGLKGDQKAKFGYHKLSSKAKYEILSFFLMTRNQNIII